MRITLLACAGEHEEDNDLEREAARQRGYLEKTVDSLRRKLAKDSELHRSDNLRIMQVRWYLRIMQPAHHAGAVGYRNKRGAWGRAGRGGEGRHNWGWGGSANLPLLRESCFGH